MKASNLLFIILISLITLIITSFMIDIRLRGEPKSSTRNRIPAPAITAELPEFSHVKIKDIEFFLLMSSDSSSNIQTVGRTEEAKQLPNYTISNDTLVISVDKKSEDIVYRLLISSNLQSITLENSRVYLRSFSQDSLFVELANSLLRSEDTNDDFGKLTVNANEDSRLEWLGGRANNVVLELNSSHAFFQNPIQKLDAHLKSSRLHLRGVNSLNIEKEGDSKLTILE